MNILLFLFAFTCLLRHSVGSAKAYDYYLFQLTWPISFCSHNRCATRPPDHFVIHGNWANRNDRKLVTYCGSQEDEYDLASIDSISDRLNEVWPALKQGDNRGFWEYQYRKHGSCATETPELAGVQHFFETTLALFDRIRLDDVLRRADFVASDQPRTYNTAHLVETLQQLYGVNVHIRCLRLNGVGLLENISFCLDKQLNPIDCQMRNQCDREFILPGSSFDFRRTVLPIRFG